MLLAALGTLLLCLLLIDGFLIADLLITGGRLELTDPREIAALSERTNHRQASKIRDLDQPEISFEAEDCGILPAVWWCQNKLFGPPLAWLYRHVPLLQTNRTALAVLALFAVVASLLRSFLAGTVAAIGGAYGTRFGDAVEAQFAPAGHAIGAE